MRLCDIEYEKINVFLEAWRTKLKVSNLFFISLINLLFCAIGIQTGKNLYLFLVMTVVVCIPASCFFFYIKKRKKNSEKYSYLYSGLCFLEITICASYFSYIIITSYLGKHLLFLGLYLAVIGGLSLLLFMVIKSKIIKGWFLKTLKPSRQLTLFIISGASGMSLAKILLNHYPRETVLFILGIGIGVFSLIGLIGIYHIMKYYCFCLVDKMKKGIND